MLLLLDEVACSRASTSLSRMSSTSFSSHCPADRARLMMSLMSDGSLLTRTKVRIPPYDSVGTPKARRPEYVIQLHHLAF